MTSIAQLVLSIALAAVAIVAVCAVALTLIPQLSLEATIRGGTIAFLTMVGIRVVSWFRLRKQQRS